MDEIFDLSFYFTVVYKDIKRLKGGQKFHASLVLRFSTSPYPFQKKFHKMTIHTTY